MMEEAKISPEFQRLLGILADKIVETIKFSTMIEHGPQIAIQLILLVLIRIGHMQNPDIVDKLKRALDLAYEQFKKEQN